MIPFHVSLEAVLALRLSCIIVANMFHVPLLVLYKATRAAENWEHFIPVSYSSCAAPDYNRLTRSLNFNCCLSGLSYCEAQIHYEIVRAVHRCMHQPRGATTHFSSRGNPFQCQFLLIFALFCHQVEAVCPKQAFRYGGCWEGTSAAPGLSLTISGRQRDLLAPCILCCYSY